MKSIIPTTMITLTVGAFEGAFLNQVIDKEMAVGFNRHFVAQFAKYNNVRHLITDRIGLIEDMTWAPYDLVEDRECKITFQR